MLRSRDAYTIVEILVAISITLLGVGISVAIVENLSFFSAKQRAIDSAMTLESYLNEALLNSSNYRPSSTALNAGAPPPLMEFYVNRDGAPLKIGQLSDTAVQRLYFDGQRNPCVQGSGPDCMYYTELSWANATPPYSIKFTVSVDDPKKKVRLSRNEQTLLVPDNLYSDTSQLKCPDDGEKYLGIKTYDSVAGTVECWRFDKSVQCPANYFPVGLKVKDPTSSDLVLDCKELREYKCPQGYVPYQAYPFDQVNLTNACISIMTEKIGLRMGHIIQNIRASQPPNVKNYYGLKWVTGKLCPEGYTLKPKLATDVFLDDIPGVFVIHNSETLTPCASTGITCGVAQDSFYCDACPYSDATRREGCEYRQYPLPPDQSANPACRDPKIFDIKPDNFANLVRDYECHLNDSVKFADGILSGGGSSD